MYKKIIASVLILMVMFVLPNVEFKTEAASVDKPEIRAPLEYQEHPYKGTFTIWWNKVTSGTVIEYIINVREMTIKDKPSDILVISNHKVSGNVSAVTFSSSALNQYGYYKASVCAVMSDGTKRWSAERYFYCSETKGVRQNDTLSFKIWNGFEYLTKEAIYYSAQTWDALLSREYINTYPYNQGVSFSELRQYDDINAIGTCNSKSNVLMTTYTIWSSDFYTEEVDIIINKYHPWGNGTLSNYDIQNVMTHEMGHAVGLIDKYESHAAEWTMYGNSDVGEQKKRTLSTQDINNHHQIYGV